jgi:peptidoglycan glycosyltransferase
MAVVALAVANDGKRLLPRFAKKDTAAPPAVSATPLSPEAAARLAEMMRRVTVSGTAAGRFDGLGYGVGGKTGTAENEENDKMSHSWFIGFAPAERPRIAFAVIVENAGYGARVAVPVAREVLRAASF